MTPYFRDAEGCIRFLRGKNSSGRIRTPRARMQKIMIYSVPVRVANYHTPAFYYTELMQHRRKRSMDVGFCKVSNGIWRANYIMSMKEVLS